MKRLYKNKQDRKICGVCSGIADFFGIDPTWVRVGWLLLSIWWGTGILIYFIAALVIPDAPDRMIIDSDSSSRF